LRSESNLQSALAEAALRERQAVEIHDNVVQGLVVALYSLEAGDSESAKDSINTTLSSAKHIVDGLLQGGAVNTLRDTAASGDDAKN
jgi:signal transduction histidine kinase